MNKLIKYLIVSIFIITTAVIFIPIKLASNDSIASNGILNLSQWSFSSNGNVKLEGNWDFYYDQLLTPNDIKNNNFIQKTFYNIPGKLSDQITDTNDGYMTLHLKVIVPSDDIYGIYFDSLFTSSNIYINGINYGGHGKVGENITQEKAIYKPNYIYFPSINNEIDIVINTSVYREISPRINPAILGTQDSITRLNYANTSIDGFTLGIMFIMLLLNIGFYFVKQRQKRHLYFSVICFLLIIRALVFNSRLLSQFFPNMPYEVLSKSAAITFYLWVTFYILFLYDIFNNTIKIKNASIIYGTSFTLLCLFTNSIVYDKFGIFAQIITALFAIYLLSFMLKQIYYKNSNATFNFFPLIVLCLITLNDSLVNNSIISNPYASIYGGILFVITESIFIINDYSKNIKKLDNINKDGLTSLFNNKYIKHLLETYINKYNLKHQIFSLLMIDIDNFKSINDNYGHMFGDKVIMDVASILKEISLGIGYAGRFGGDEFILILPKSTEKEAINIANRIMKSLDYVNKTYDINTTVSLSIGVYQNDVDNLEDCMNNADNAMYISKTNGKNQINNLTSALG